MPPLRRLLSCLASQPVPPLAMAPGREGNEVHPGRWQGAGPRLAAVPDCVITWQSTAARSSESERIRPRNLGSLPAGTVTDCGRLPTEPSALQQPQRPARGSTPDPAASQSLSCFIPPSPPPSAPLTGDGGEEHGDSSRKASATDPKARYRQLLPGVRAGSGKARPGRAQVTPPPDIREFSGAVFCFSRGVRPPFPALLP